MTAPLWRALLVVVMLSSCAGKPAAAQEAGFPADARSRLAASSKVGADVVAALASTPRVRVLVALVPPASNAPGRDPERARAARATVDAVLVRMPADAFEIRRRFQAIAAVALETSADGLLPLLDDPRVLRIDVDAPGSGELAQAVPLVHLDAVQALGFNGAGVTVAVLDSGHAVGNPDLDDSIVAEQCFCSGSGGCCPNGMPTQSGAGSADDDHGHGSNVTGIITSNGTVAPRGGAPAAGIVAVKVLDAQNGFCCTSDIVAALDWVLGQRPDVDLVNMSLGTNALFGGNCDTASSFTMALAQAVDALRNAGVLSFVSAGNSGSGTQMNAPACVANAISVGAVWDSNVGAQSALSCTDPTTAADQVTCFSNSDATTDIFAPGAPMTSTGIGGTSTFYGTSQASPLVAACAATLLQAQPTLTPAEIESALESSSVRVTDATNGLAFPRLDCADALARVRQPSAANVAKCERAIARESATLFRKTSALLLKCTSAKVAGKLPAATDCSAELTTAAKIAKLRAAHKAKLAKACGGIDKLCGGNTALEITPATVGWPATCPGLGAASCDRPIADCGDVADCVACLHDAGLGLANGGAAAARRPPTAGDPHAKAVGKCRRALGVTTDKLVAARLAALAKCWDARLKGAHANVCPSPGDGKAVAVIAKAEAKRTAVLCKACGGDDKRCGGADDLTAAEIGFDPACDAVCGTVGTIATLTAGAQCLDCLANYAVDCAETSHVPRLSAYPDACRP